MIRGVALVLAVAGMALASTPAQACRMFRPLDMARVVAADAVMMGRLTDYEIVRDEAFRERMLASPALTDDMRALYRGEGSLLPDYARFTFAPSETLLGEEPASFTVTWDNSTFAEPDTLPDGEYLIAIRHLDPDAAVYLTPFRGHPVLLQAPCSAAFIFAADDPRVGEIRSLLAGG